MKRARLNVVGNEQVGPYFLVRVERGVLDPGVSGPVLHARGAGPSVAEADVGLPRAAG